MISINIDCKKIEKARLVPGKKGESYLDMILIPTPNSQYGNDYMVVQSVSKEERERKVRGPILGNAKILGRKQPVQEEGAPEADEPETGDDVPF